MSKRTGVYLSDDDERQLAESGKTLPDVIRAGFRALRHADWLAALDELERSGGKVHFEIEYPEKGAST